MANTNPGPVLTTSQYTEPGVYIGEILNPETANLSANARIPAIIAKGSTYAVADNVGIIRAFIYGETLNFSRTPPFVAETQHLATGQQQLPNQLFQQDGTVLPISQWKWLQDSDGYYAVQISDQAFSSLQTYLLDYQSTDVTVLDQIPIAEIRQIQEVGTQLNEAQYTEYQSFYVPMSFTAPTPDPSNVHPLPWLDASVVQMLQPGSTGSAVFDPSAQYLFNYDRSYAVTCVSASGSTPNRTATFSWSAVNDSGGNHAAPPVPLNVADTAPTFTINENTPLSLVQTVDAYGVKLDFAFGGVNFVAGDEFTYTAHGPSLLEIDQRYTNPQFATVTSNFVSGNAGGLQIQVPDTSNYLLPSNNSYYVKLLTCTGVTPNRVMTFCWARYGDLVQSTNGNFTILENNPITLTQPLTDGVQISFVVGVTSPIPGAIWNMVAQAPRIYYTAKDSRIYNVNVASISTPVSNVTTINGGYTTNTTEGGFGVFSVKFDSTGVSNGVNGTGFNLFPDNISVAFRNFPSFAPLDIFTFSVLDSDLMDWSLNVITQQVFQLTDYKTDMNGAITGTAGQQYVILAQVPASQTSIRVQNYNTSADISFNWVIGTPYIFFTTAPGVPITITYQTLAPQPDPGQTYYMTVLFLRPVSYYNNPFLVLRLQDGQNFAAPSTTTNDLYQGNQILWANGALGTYLVQPQNLDGSGVYSITDYETAIMSIRSFPRISDLCLLNFPAGLSQVLEENILGNDPFQQRPNLVWWGMPIGTPIGDETTAGSLVYEALNSLAVTGNSAAHGTRIQVGETEAVLQVVLSTGQSANITVDGSFIALAGAALVASFADPATDILGQLVNGFTSITLYTQAEQKLLGAAQINYINGQAGGPYFWGEDFTVDPNVGFNLIQLMTQRAYVTSVVIRGMKSLIGIVPVSTTAAEALVQGNLASILRGLLAQGLIGPYLDASQNPRAFDPNTDIIVFQDVNDDTLFFFNYAWFSRNVIKRLYGLYSLNSNDFSTGVALQ